MTENKTPVSLVNIQDQIDKKIQKEVDDAMIPDQETIEYLEFLLDEAKKGEIQEICFAYRYWDGVTFDSHFTGYGELPEAMVGTMYRLVDRYSKFYYDDEEDE